MTKTRPRITAAIQSQPGRLTRSSRCRSVGRRRRGPRSTVSGKRDARGRGHGRGHGCTRKMMLRPVRGPYAAAKLSVKSPMPVRTPSGRVGAYPRAGVGLFRRSTAADPGPGPALCRAGKAREGGSLRCVCRVDPLVGASDERAQAGEPGSRAAGETEAGSTCGQGPPRAGPGHPRRDCCGAKHRHRGRDEARIDRRLRTHIAGRAGGLDAAVPGVAERVDAEGDQPGGDDPEQERAVGGWASFASAPSRPTALFGL